MATKADIVITATDKASATIEAFTKNVENSAKRGADAYSKIGQATKDNIEALNRFIEVARERGIAEEEAEKISDRLSAAVQRETSEINNLRASTAVLNDATRQLGGTIDQTTEALRRQEDPLVRLPTSILTLRGSWLSLFLVLISGSSVIYAARQAIRAITEELGEAIQRDEEAAAAISRWTEKIGFGADVAAQSFVPAIKESVNWLDRFEDSAINALNAAGGLLDRLLQFAPIWGQATQALEDHIIASGEIVRQSENIAEGAERIANQYQRLIDQRAEETFEAQQQAIFEASESVGEYVIRIMTLLQAEGMLAEVVERLGLAETVLGIALDHNNRALEERQRLLDEAMTREREIGQEAEEVGRRYEQLGSEIESLANQTSNALFRMGQAWESYQFRVAQTIAAFQFRITQMQARFDHQMWSMQARASAAGAAAAARHALDIETITQDHYDRLEDMARQHQEELRRTLQRAPWYLQRHIREYYRRRNELQEAGDEEGLEQLRRDFIERIRTIDPIFAEELEHLEQLQQDERDVEEREFQQRLERARRQYAISRAQAQANYAIQLADAQFAYQQQQEAAEFAYEQQLASMEFGYEQQRDAAQRSFGQIQEDLEDALAERLRIMNEWATDEVRREYLRWFEIGRAGIEGYYAGWGMEPPPTPIPTPPRPGWTEYQGGLPYVPQTMPAIVHPGEAILTKGEASAWREGGGVINIYFYGPVYMRSRQEVQVLATDLSRELGRRTHVRR